MKQRLAFLGIFAALSMLVSTFGFAASSAPTEITLAFWGGDGAFPDGSLDAMAVQVQKDLNITIKALPYSWGDFGQKSSVWAASNDLPDVTAAAPGYATAATWAEGGVLHALPSDLSKYPSLKFLDQPPTQLVTFGGKIYAIPRYQFADSSYYYAQTVLVAHKDIFNSLGLSKFPETMDQLRSMLRAIKAKYPTVTPLVFWNNLGPANLVHNYIPAANVGRGDVWVLEDGKYIPGFFSRKTLEAVKVFRSLMNDGLIDKDFVSQNNNSRKNQVDKQGGRGDDRLSYAQPLATELGPVHAEVGDQHI